jgi:hypothetical protein
LIIQHPNGLIWGRKNNLLLEGTFGHFLPEKAETTKQNIFGVGLRIPLPI